MKLPAIPAKIKNQLRKLAPIARHHYFIVSVVIFGSLAFGVYSINQTLNTPSDSEYRDKQMQSTIGSKFNQSAKDTISKIKQLQKSTDTSSQETPFPTGRINPFAE